jgi:hypothetical protein
VQTLEEHQDKIEANKEQIAAHKQYIETNQQNISNPGRLRASLRCIPHTNRAMPPATAVPFTPSRENTTVRASSALGEVLLKRTGLAIRAGECGLQGLFSPCRLQQ